MKTICTYGSAALVVVAVYSCQHHPTVQSNTLEGKVKLESVSVVPKLGGRIARVLVEEGQQVQAGDTVAILSVPELAAKMEQAEGAIEAAAGQYDLARNGATSEQVLQLQSQNEAAEAQFQFAQTSVRRLEQMFRDSLIPAQQMDEARTKMNLAAAQLKAATAKLNEIQSGTRPEAIQSARGQWIRAKGSRQELQEAVKEQYLIAPAAMRVETISLKPGEMALPGYTLINGYAIHAMYFRFTIGEHQLNRFPNGSTVLVEVPETHLQIPSRIIAVKQLPRYAENSSTAPNRQLAEAFYELKVVPQHPEQTPDLIQQSTVLIQSSVN